jgi:hypothetical protein
MRQFDLGPLAEPYGHALIIEVDQAGMYGFVVV